ncbi:MAG: hypothetical protein ACXWB9_03635, partial [Flavisolibacter sp.]
ARNKAALKMKKNLELIFITLVSLTLIGVGWWGLSGGHLLIGIISIIAGVIIGVNLYGEKFGLTNWMDWWK